MPGVGTGDDSLAKLDIPLPVHRDIATCLPYIVDDVGLIRHVPLSERDHIFEVICQEFPADVDSLDVFPHDLAIFDRHDMAERVAEVDHDTACRWYIAVVAEQSAVRDERGSYPVSGRILIVERDLRVLRK